MCGRMTIGKDDPQDVAAAVSAKLEPALASGWTPRYNVAPTQKHPVVVVEEGARWLRGWSWGLRRGAAVKPLINARAETVKHLPAFREAYAARRCLAVVDGFYEWETIAGAKQPTWFHRADGGLLVIAALWEPPVQPNGVETFTVLTTAPNDVVAPIHNRMPAFLEGDAVDRWLRGDMWRLGPASSELLVARAVSARVNSVKNDDRSCLAARADRAQLSL